MKPTTVFKRSFRLELIRALFIVVGLLFVARLFYVQVLRAEYYKSLARAEQFRELEIEPERGTIYVQNSSREPSVVAINESRFTIFVDPSFISEKDVVAAKLSGLLTLPYDEVRPMLDRVSRYVVLAKKQTKEVKEKVASEKIKGVAWKEERQRLYPQNMLASQVLGFVNDDGIGQYGIEGYLDDELAGTPGIVRAVTDVTGIPLAQNEENVVEQPKDGTDIVLTIDQNIQQLAEEQLKSGVERSGAKSGSVIVMETNTGRVKAMANYPSFNPNEFNTVEDQELFKNKVVTDALEPGSITKTLTVSAAIDQGVIGRDGTYYDSRVQEVDGFRITNALEFGSGTKSVFDILQFSLNTGAVEMLKLLGGGEINAQARSRLHMYFSDKFLLGKPSTIEQEGAGQGIVPDPIEGDGRNIQYANMSFGQGFTVTIQQFASALSSAINGGTYYSPTVIYSRIDNNQNQSIQQPKVVERGVVTETTSESIRSLMEDYARSTRINPRSDFIMGGKTGTAQIADGQGGYRTDVYNTTFAGFIGKTKPSYTIVVRLNEGNALSGEFTGFKSARPVFTGIAEGMYDSVAFNE